MSVSVFPEVIRKRTDGKDYERRMESALLKLKRTNLRLLCGRLGISFDKADEAPT